MFAAALIGDWAQELRYFQFRETELDGIPLIVARSGWSKQGGVELYLRDGNRGTELWGRVKEAGAPFGIGPGAPNDIERLESGLISYGADMRHQSLPANPFEMGFGPMNRPCGGSRFHQSPRAGTDRDGWSHASPRGRDPRRRARARQHATGAAMPRRRGQSDT